MLEGRKHTTIGRLGVRAAVADPWAARRGAERLLDAADIHPPGLPPSAILCVQRLADPLPGRFDLGGRDPVQAMSWGRAVAQALEAAARRAARPIEGAVPAGADAVIFADRAELLACLASDAWAGALSARWWWKHLVPEAATSPAGVATAFLAWPEHAPAALQILAERGEILSALGALPPASAAAILAAVVERFGLVALADAVAPAVERGSIPERAERDAPEPPWTRWAPEATAGAPRSVASLLAGVALVVHRAQEEARSRRFAVAVRAWLEDGAPSVSSEPLAVAVGEPPASEPDEIPAPSSIPEVEQPERWAVEARTHEPTVVAEAPRFSPETSTALPPPPDAHASTPPALADSVGRTDRPSPVVTAPLGAIEPPPPPSAEVAARVAQHSAPPSPSHEVAPAIAPPLSPPEAVLLASPAAAPPPDAPSVAPPLAETALAETRRSVPTPSATVATSVVEPRAYPALERAVCVDTAFGGLFFLINVGLYLGLYGDFMQPRSPGIDLSIWDFVTLAGRDLLGEAAVATPDPIWTVLADLAGREESDPPGAAFDPPDAWRMSAAWLEPFGGGHAFAWSTRGGRLVVRHPDGFVLVDVPFEEDAGQAAREAAPYAMLGAIGEEEAGEEPPGGAPLERWLGRLLPYVRARLARALGVGKGEVGAVMCSIPAKVMLDAARLDAVMSLSRLPIEVRFAGLDRDPGWVPAAGRSVLFHFE
jgi:hypothetical protein